MNRISCDFPSGMLKEQVQVTVLLPKPRPSLLTEEGNAPRGPFPTLYLLHGALEDPTGWLYHSDLASLVDELGLAVVLPAGGNSFYVDDGRGGRQFFSYLTRELPEYLEQLLPLSGVPEGRFIGGLSMGGYGAVHAALKKPGFYGKVFSMSGALDIARAAGFIRTCGGDLPECLRDRKVLPGSQWDLFALLRSSGAALPKTLLTCGDRDYFLPGSQTFARESGAELRISPGGHDWAFWRRSLEECLRWLAE